MGRACSASTAAPRAVWCRTTCRLGFWTVVVSMSRLTYALTAWRGFVTASDIQLVHAFEPIPDFWEQLAEVNTKLKPSTSLLTTAGLLLYWNKTCLRNSQPWLRSVHQLHYANGPSWCICPVSLSNSSEAQSNSSWWTQKMGFIMPWYQIVVGRIDVGPLKRLNRPRTNGLQTVVVQGGVEVVCITLGNYHVEPQSRFTRLWFVYIIHMIRKWFRLHESLRRSEFSEFLFALASHTEWSLLLHRLNDPICSERGSSGGATAAPNLNGPDNRQ